MLKKIFITLAASLLICAATAHAQDTDKPVIAVDMFQTFETVGDTKKISGEYCSDAIIEKLLDSQIFVVLDSEATRTSFNEIIKQLDDVVSDKVVAGEKLEPAYLVRGLLDVQTEAAAVNVLIDFELVDAKTDELIWGRRVRHNELLSQEDLPLQFKIHDAIYRTADKVVNRLVADINSGKLVLK